MWIEGLRRSSQFVTVVLRECLRLALRSERDCDAEAWEHFLECNKVAAKIRLKTGGNVIRGSRTFTPTAPILLHQLR